MKKKMTEMKRKHKLVAPGSLAAKRTIKEQQSTVDGGAFDDPDLDADADGDIDLDV